MTATVVRGIPSLAIPSTQNSAPIVEFRCLYTHDLRRKSKRWQDGFLRFHTFNKRVMVYDVPRNFVGDMHWRESGELQDGDELELEKGILVQVGELVGRVDQDLSGLFEKKIKGREDRAAQDKHTDFPARNKLSSPATPARHPNCNGMNAPVPTPMSQLLPKTLNTLLGTPRGPHGRAIVPTKSPFQQTHRVADDTPKDKGRAIKRRKLDDVETINGPRNVTQKRKTGAPSNAHEGPRGPARVDIQPRQGSHIRNTGPSSLAVTERDVIDVDADCAAPVNTIHRPTKGRSRPPEAAGNPPRRRYSRSSSPAVSTTSSHLPTNEALNKASRPINRPIEIESDDAPTQPLRLVGHAPRKKLLCSAAPTLNHKRARAEISSEPSPDPPDELEKFNSAQQLRLQARQRRIRQQDENDLSNRNNEQIKAPETHNSRTKVHQRPISLPVTLPPIQHTNNRQQNPTTQSPHPTQPKARSYGFTRAPKPAPILPPLSNDTLTEMALTHGKMDQILLLPQPSKSKSPLRRTQSEIVPRPPEISQSKVQKSQSQPQGLRKSQAKPVITSVAPKPLTSAESGGKAKEFEMQQKKDEKMDKDLGPWSREAFDLFDWRPPDRGGVQEMDGRESSGGD
ncbi:MAG: hypothetical protein M1812_003368 [Candelaria pacifica]|nr:MAG: hypothetical protein M1812_003368 [Candelaria pacifica]